VKFWEKYLSIFSRKYFSYFNGCYTILLTYIYNPLNIFATSKSIESIKTSSERSYSTCKKIHSTFSDDISSALENLNT